MKKLKVILVSEFKPISKISVSLYQSKLLIQIFALHNVVIKYL